MWLQYSICPEVVIFTFIFVSILLNKVEKLISLWLLLKGPVVHWPLVKLKRWETCLPCFVFVIFTVLDPEKIQGKPQHLSSLQLFPMWYLVALCSVQPWSLRRHTKTSSHQSLSGSFGPIHKSIILLPSQTNCRIACFFFFFFFFSPSAYSGVQRLCIFVRIMRATPSHG